MVIRVTKMKRLLFSVTKKDFDVQTFRSGGKGGQNQNKVESGVRIVHRDSGAVGESREERSQAQNKKIAFHRLVESKKFKAWHMIRCAELVGHKTVDEIVEERMDPKNLRIEARDEQGKWVREADVSR